MTPENPHEAPDPHGADDSQPEPQGSDATPDSEAALPPAFPDTSEPPPFRDPAGEVPAEERSVEEVSAGEESAEEESAEEESRKKNPGEEDAAAAFVGIAIGTLDRIEKDAADWESDWEEDETVDKSAVEKTAEGALSVGSRPLTGLLVLLVLAALGPLVQWWIQPPTVQPMDVSGDRFSAARAFESLKWIAAEPHPAGSEAHTRVRERLVRELEQLGAEVQQQEGVGSRWWDGHETPLVNLVARLRANAGPEGSPAGTAAGGDALLLVAHYDSVAFGPGAGDDGAAVASLLETLRALGTDANRSNDLLVLLSDGEESGLLGAKLFLGEGHPWLGDVGAVLNFEGRGAGGPSLLFQVGPNSGSLVKLYAEEVPHGMGSSVAPAVYERMPNDTDFTVFLGKGYRGLNFAFVGGGLAYHGKGDRPDQLDLGTLQMQGDSMLAMARAFSAEGPGKLPKVPDQEFLILPGFRLVYPRELTLPLTVGLALGLLVFVLCRAFNPGALGRAGVLRTLSGIPGALFLAACAGCLVYYGSGAIYVATDWLLGLIGQRPEAVAGSNLRAGEWLASGAWLVGLGVLLMGVSCLGRGRNRIAARRRLDALAAGSLVPLILGGAALAILVPGAGHVGLLTMAGSGACLWWTAPGRTRRPAKISSTEIVRDPNSQRAAAVLGLIAWLPAALALLPLLGLLVQVGSVRPNEERLLAAATVALAMLSVLPLLSVVGARRERLATLLLIVGAILFVLRTFSDLAVRVS